MKKIFILLTIIFINVACFNNSSNEVKVIDKNGGKAYISKTGEYKTPLVNGQPFEFYFFFEDGKIKERQQLRPASIRKSEKIDTNSYYTAEEYYRNGNTKKRFDYVYDEGLETFFPKIIEYYENGVIASSIERTGEYKKIGNDIFSEVQATSYYQNGVIKSHSNVHRYLKSVLGESRYKTYTGTTENFEYYENGNLKVYLSYFGEREKIREEYYYNGNIKKIEKSYYDDGVINYSAEYYPNGVVSEIIYRQKDKDGKYKTSKYEYDQTGRKF